MRSRFAYLTQRERAVLGALTYGRSADEIAAAMCVNICTVRTHIRNILMKLDVRSMHAAVALAWRSGWECDEEAACAA